MSWHIVLQRSLGMKVISFVRKGIELTPVEVELSLTRGLPQFRILGLPDTVIKESLLRIRSALSSQGFRLPQNKQVVVNLRPTYMKKESCGLDLAIACAYLWETGQLPVTEYQGKVPYVYGELGLDGRVICPEDLDTLYDLKDERMILTGFPRMGSLRDLLSVEDLSSLEEPTRVAASLVRQKLERPNFSEFTYSNDLAKLIAVIAIGEHSVLLAGPSGSGKTTLAETLHSVLRDPSPEEVLPLQRLARLFGEKLNWRPKVSPHHSIPPISMIGGGLPPIPGEITRAHGGVLILDELLEFHSRVKEALREPIEKGEITVSRRGMTVTYPAKSLLLATTNLCPCGSLVPGRVAVSCRFSLVRCRSYLERLSGPLLDRFSMLVVTKPYAGESRKVTACDIYDKVKLGQEFARSSRGQAGLNSQLKLAELKEMMDSFTFENLLPDMNGSQRRKLATLQVARSVADLEGSQQIELPHIQEAFKWTFESYSKLQELHS